MEPKTVEEDLAQLKEEDLKPVRVFSEETKKNILLFILILFFGWTFYIAFVFAF